jgi:hypothetical protein
VNAQVGTAEPSSRSTEFVPVEGGTESTSAELLLVVAYLVMWSLMLGFIGLAWRRQAKLENRLSELERQVSGKTPPA